MTQSPKKNEVRNHFFHVSKNEISKKSIFSKCTVIFEGFLGFCRSNDPYAGPLIFVQKSRKKGTFLPLEISKKGGYKLSRFELLLKGAQMSRGTKGFYSTPRGQIFPNKITKKPVKI